VSRSVHYEINVQARGRALTSEGESAAEELLAKHPLVTCYDTGRGWLVWWEIRPGQEARELKHKLEQVCTELSEPRKDA